MEELIKQVTSFLEKDDSGHSMDHVMRVLHLATKFAQNEPANLERVTYIALLHDVDDYKLFGIDNAQKLPHARQILEECCISKDEQENICSELSKIGYSKRLQGIQPETIEGKLVSDADMCDALGITGIIRTYQYSLKHNCPFFNSKVFPRSNLDAKSYMKSTSSTSVDHIFEKILKLKKFMLTEAGKKEAESRHQIVIEVLHHLFQEEDAPEWEKYLTQYLKEL